MQRSGSGVLGTLQRKESSKSQSRGGCSLQISFPELVFCFLQLLLMARISLISFTSPFTFIATLIFFLSKRTELSTYFSLSLQTTNSHIHSFVLSYKHLESKNKSTCCNKPVFYWTMKIHFIYCVDFVAPSPQPHTD